MLSLGNRSSPAVIGGLAVLMAAVASACTSATSSATPIDEVSSVAAQALQVADDAAYLPVEVNGRWSLAGPPGTWLQPSISTTSSPWRWNYPCAVIDSTLVPGMTSFMDGEIARTFSPAKAATLRTQLQQRLDQSTNTSCHSLNPNVAEGPPGPILDRLVIEHVSVSGGTATVQGEVHVTDWQGGVSHVPTADGGRQVELGNRPGTSGRHLPAAARPGRPVAGDVVLGDVCAGTQPLSHTGSP